MNTNLFLVPFDGSFIVNDASTKPDKDIANEKSLRKLLREASNDIDKLQRKLYADDKHAVLLIIQAMDAAGKDSTIRNVMRGVNPAGCQVFSFKQPSKEELDHDFLWRTAKRLPERGRIGVFNRSYYEEALVVRVHPEYLQGQKLPGNIDHDTIWDNRFHSIREHEQHLARNGTVILKIWLNVSKEEQKNRFIERLRNPSKNWKFSSGDIEERKFWPQYMAAYENMINETSRAYAPWYAIPADNKPFARLCVAKIIIETMKNLNLQYPSVAAEEKIHFAEMENSLLNE